MRIRSHQTWIQLFSPSAKTSVLEFVYLKVLRDVGRLKLKAYPSHTKVLSRRPVQVLQWESSYFLKSTRTISSLLTHHDFVVMISFRVSFYEFWLSCNSQKSTTAAFFTQENPHKFRAFAVGDSKRANALTNSGLPQGVPWYFLHLMWAKFKQAKSEITCNKSLFHFQGPSLDICEWTIRIFNPQEYSLVIIHCIIPNVYA